MEKTLTRRDKVLITLVVLTTIAVIVLSIFLGIYTHDRGKYKGSIENVYRHAYYSLMENYVDIETDLEKLKVIRGTHMTEEVLGNISDNAELASLSLSTLNTSSNDLTAIFKFTNQVGDYSRFLLRKMEKGEDIADGERATLQKMHEIARKIGDALSSVRHNVATDSYSFVDSLGTQDDIFSSTIRELNNGSVEYPALIYDGPFSDGISDREPKYLKGDKITKEQGVDKLKGVFDHISTVTYSSTNTNKFTSFLYDITFNDGSSGSMQLSEIGGHILMFTSYVESTDDVVSEEEAIKIASIFLENNGYNDMFNVYASLSRGTFYLNFAPKVDDVIYYPDLIKVKVNATTGKITGIESLNYIYNHMDRSIPKDDIITEIEAIEKASVDMDIRSVRLALIPQGVEKEALTYEIIGYLDENRFYIYIDAKTGDEVNVLMEIKSSGGNLLI